MEEVVLKVAQALDVNITPNDIEISHKLKRRGSNNIIIAKFVSHKTKSKLYKERTKLKDIRLTDLFPSFATATHAGCIFINENLTNFRRCLLGKAIDMKRDDLLISAWTIDGKVFLKTSPEGRPIKIDSFMLSLRDLVQSFETEEELTWFGLSDKWEVREELAHRLPKKGHMEMTTEDRRVTLESLLKLCPDPAAFQRCKRFKFQSGGTQKKSADPQCSAIDPPLPTRRDLERL